MIASVVGKLKMELRWLSVLRNYLFGTVVECPYQIDKNAHRKWTGPATIHTILGKHLDSGATFIAFQRNRSNQVGQFGLVIKGVSKGQMLLNCIDRSIFGEYLYLFIMDNTKWCQTNIYLKAQLPNFHFQLCTII